MDKKIIDTLSNFASAFDMLVDELRVQSKKTEDTKYTMSGIFGNGGVGKQIQKLTEGIKSIKDDTKELIKNQKELLKLSKKNNQQSETGLFDAASDKGQMDKIKSGVGSIILIAGAVLVIGAAFGLVPKLDIMNVITLAASIALVGMTLAKLYEGGLPSPKESLELGLSILLFTGGVVASSYLINLMPEIDTSKILSFAGIGLGFALLLSTGFLYSLAGIDYSDVAKLPLVLPAIALGVMLSSFIMDKTQTVDYGKLLNIAAISGTLALATLVMMPTMFLMNMMGAKLITAALIGVVALPLISLAIMLSSHILAEGKWENPIPLPWAVSFGMAMLVLALPVAILGLIPLPVILSGAAALVIVSAAIVLSSYILGSLSDGIFEKIADSLKYFMDKMVDVVKGMMDFMPNLIKAAADFVEKVLPPLRDFLVGIIPPLTDFLQTVLHELFPVIKEIFSFLKTIITEVDDVLLAFSKIIDSAVNVFPKIGEMFESIGTALATPINAISSLLETFADTFERIVNTTVNGIQTLASMNPDDLVGITASLHLLGGAMGALTGGFSDTIINLFAGGSQDPLTRILSSIQKYGPSVDGVGGSILSLSKGIKELNDIDIDDDQVEKVANVLERIGNASANINVSGEQVINAKNLVEQLNSFEKDKNEEFISKMDIIISQLSLISGSSGSISSQLELLRLEINDKEPSVGF